MYFYLSIYNNLNIKYKNTKKLGNLIGIIIPIFFFKYLIGEIFKCYLVQVKF